MDLSFSADQFPAVSLEELLVRQRIDEACLMRFGNIRPCFLLAQSPLHHCEHLLTAALAVQVVDSRLLEKIDDALKASLVLLESSSGSNRCAQRCSLNARKGSTPGARLKLEGTRPASHT
jgi:hypothetical protein